MKLHWQVAPLGTAFTAASGVVSLPWLAPAGQGGTTSWTNTLPSGLTFIQEVSGLTSDTPYHWRVRLLYRQNRLGQTASRWIHIPWNGWNEQDFRASAYTRRTITYTYDPLYRLVEADYSTGELFEYVYDAASNRTAMTSTTPLSGTVVTTYTYDIANRLTEREVSDSRTYTYTWSNRNQLLAEYIQGYPVRTFAYNATGQMITATVFTLTTHFTYNGDGARIAVSVEGHGTTTYTLDYAAGYRILAEQTGITTTLYLYGHECLGELRDDEWLYYLTDGTGYVRQGVDDEGKVVSVWLFDPDGTVLEGPEGPVSHLVCGGVYDWSTGLLYKDGRYFDPLMGIWLALTPLAVLQLWRRRKKGKSAWDVLLVALVVIGVGATVTACGQGPGPGPTLTSTVCITTTPLPIRVLHPITSTPPPSSTPPPTDTLPPTNTPTPTFEPPEPNCTPTDREPWCIDPDIDTEQVMVAHVVLQEGGSCLGYQCMVNISHVIRNRIYDTSGLFPFNIAIGIVSQSNDSGGRAFDAWDAPSAREGSPLWGEALKLANLLIGGGALPEASSGITEKTVFFQSCDPPSYVPVETAGNPKVAADVGPCAQYYYNSLPTYQCAAPTPTVSP